MLLSLLLCFSDTLMQSYIHYYAPPEETDKEEENNKPDLQIVPGPARTSSAAARDMTALLSASGLYGSKLAEIPKGADEPGDMDVDVEAKAVDPNRPVKEAIFDFAMRPESAVVSAPAIGWDTNKNTDNMENTAK